MVNLKQVETYHKKKGAISKVILSKTDKHEIIFGARAINKHLPSFLDRHTQDYDIFTPTPKRDARQTERALDKHMGFNAFEVKPALHVGTLKVKSRVTGEGVADYSKPEERIPFKRIGGKNYITINRIERNIRKTLKDPEAKFRRDKDQDALRRIQVYKKLKTTKKRKTKPRVPSIFNFGNNLFNNNRGGFF